MRSVGCHVAYHQLAVVQVGATATRRVAAVVALLVPQVQTMQPTTQSMLRALDMALRPSFTATLVSDCMNVRRLHADACILPPPNLNRVRDHRMQSHPWLPWRLTIASRHPIDHRMIQPQRQTIIEQWTFGQSTFGHRISHGMKQMIS